MHRRDVLKSMAASTLSWSAFGWPAGRDWCKSCRTRFEPLRLVRRGGVVFSLGRRCRRRPLSSTYRERTRFVADARLAGLLPPGV